ncbi:hypothetical protein [Micromonospora sp. Mcm103]|uniref:hypothetical protein n=1 Tax=Micromonospora sp. Mcm103 TaxID=2926015 RepID=UPI0021CA3000|nr:hypothetical protein [Micromonospora sp. Mcm103]
MTRIKWFVSGQDHQSFAPFGIASTAMLARLRDEPDHECSSRRLLRSALRTSAASLPCRDPAP